MSIPIKPLREDDFWIGAIHKHDRVDYTVAFMTDVSHEEAIRIRDWMIACSKADYRAIAARLAEALENACTTSKGYPKAGKEYDTGREALKAWKEAEGK